MNNFAYKNTLDNFINLKYFAFNYLNKSLCEPVLIKESVKISFSIL